MARSDVNNSARALMGMIGRWEKDTDGSLSSTGGTTAYAIGIYRDTVAAARGEEITFKVNATNTGAVTLNVTYGAAGVAGGGSARGAVAVQKAGAALIAGEWKVGDIVTVRYDGTQYQTMTSPNVDIARTWATAQTFGAATAGTTLTLSAQPWLLATANTQNNVTGDNTNYTLLWAGEIKDRGSNFASPTWTAPFTGAYLIGGALQLAGLASTDTLALCTVVATSRTMTLFDCNLGAMRDSGNTLVQPFCQVIDMTAADTLVTKIQCNGTSGKTVDIETDSRLSIVFLG